MIAALLMMCAVETRVLETAAETAALQYRLSNRCVLAEYSDRVRTVGGTNIWSDALQAALDDHEIVKIEPLEGGYWIDRSIVVPSDRRIEAEGAVVRLLPCTRELMFRNRNVIDGTLRPVPEGRRDRNIAFVGGRYEDWCRRRYGYGRSGRYGSDRRIGRFLGVSTLFLFSNCDHVTMRGVTIADAGSFAVQAGDGRGHIYEDIRFDKCFVDGLHLNGNLSRVLVRNVRGQVGDDLVALNAYDWLRSSVNFGPQRDILCENLELIVRPDFKVYPAIRIQPAKFRYADGSEVDCSVSDVVFRKVRGVTTFKMYLQTPAYEIGGKPEWSGVGSGGNIRFEDVKIDLDGPIDMIGGYVMSDPARGHFGAFEIGANLNGVHFKDIDIRFNLEEYPLSHLLTVGPKSCIRVLPDGRRMEIFDPYVSCRVKNLTLENVRIRGRKPAELVRESAFNDINGDGRSTGGGRIETPAGDRPRFGGTR
jgi:hypothetical protein